MTSSPGSRIASIAAIIPSVAPQVTVISVSGSGSQPGYVLAVLAAIESRSGFAPHVIAYWLTSAKIASAADTTAPVGSSSVVHDDRASELIRLDVTATDALSGVATVDVSGDGITWASYTYAPQVDWSVFDPAAGGAPGLGNRTIRIRWTDGVGNTSVAVTTTLYLGSSGALEYPVPPVTGKPFTI